MNQDKFLDQFHYFNIHAGIDSVYGNWAVSTEGDVVNCLYPYAILSFHIYDVDWIEIIGRKVWFRSECKENLKQALDRAMNLIKARNVYSF